MTTSIDYGNDFIYPAIDLRGGRVVRLAQGDPARETEYADDSEAFSVARGWQADGATWLHVVNLDGALGETGRENLATLSRILTTGLRVQFGGGLRTLEAMREALALGVSRIVLGTVAVEEPALAAAALTEFGAERVAVGIDAHDGLAQVRGWQEATSIEAAVLAQQWAELGGRWVIFTDVSRDGMGSGVNVEAAAELAYTTGLNVIASGGVGSLEHIRRVQQAGLYGVIVGRALYEGQVNLAQALQSGCFSCVPGAAQRLSRARTSHRAHNTTHEVIIC